MSQSVYESQSPQPAAPRQETAQGCILRVLVSLGEIIVLIGLSLYIVFGAENVPFHGDESTILFTTRDVSYLLNNQMEHIFYSPNPENIGPSAATEQELRLLNGTVARYVYGFFAMNPETREPYEPINEQWDWGADFAYNVETGHMPTPLQLSRARLISSLFLVGAMLSLYGLTRMIGGPGAALIAVVYFTFNPAVLINGRRAMMESSWLFFGLLGLWMAAWLCARIRGVPSGSLQRRRGPFMPAPLVTYLRLGAVLGLALASKHTALFYVGAIIGAVMLAPLWAKRRIWLKHMIGLPLMIAVMIGVFLLLNPAWWGDPIGRLNGVLRLRSDLLAGQTATFGGYADTGERLTGLIRQAFVVQPQYYEVANWNNFIADQITAYEASGWQGFSIGGSMTGALVVIVLVMVGIIACARALFTPKTPVIETVLDPAEFLSQRKKIAQESIGVSLRREQAARDAVVIVAPPAPMWPSPMGAWVALWLGLAGVGAAIATPLEWQRYYLPLYPAIAVFLGVGVIALVRVLTTRRAPDTTPRDAVISL